MTMARMENEGLIPKIFHPNTNTVTNGPQTLFPDPGLFPFRLTSFPGLLYFPSP